jgi:two-component system response regulator MprA/two-component system response regulator TrcR
MAEAKPETAGRRRHMRPGTRVLIVEDDRSIARVVQLQLEHDGLAVLCCHDGISGLEAVPRFRPQLIVLDIMLPGLDGVGVLKELRLKGHNVAVIMLTARDTPLDKVHSLDHGADDYLSKPFDMGELMARIRALLRRVEGEEVVRVADLEIDTAAHIVRRRDREIGLTAREYELLVFMARNTRRVLSRETLLWRVWEQDFDVGTNVVEVYVGYLRKKIDAPGEKRLIHTVRGAGYILRGD